MARIDEFKNIAGVIEFEDWHNDIKGMLREAMEAGGYGITTRDICDEYYDDLGLEELLFVGQQMQIIRGQLEQEPTPRFLLNENRRWYMVNDPERARAFLVNRTRRMLNQYERLGRYVNIGRITYALEAYSEDTEALIRAIETNEPGMRALREALEIDQPEEQ